MYIDALRYLGTYCFALHSAHILRAHARAHTHTLMHLHSHMIAGCCSCDYVHLTGCRGKSNCRYLRCCLPQMQRIKPTLILCVFLCVEHIVCLEHIQVCLLVCLEHIHASICLGSLCMRLGPASLHNASRVCVNTRYVRQLVHGCRRLACRSLAATHLQHNSNKWQHTATHFNTCVHKSHARPMINPLKLCNKLQHSN